MNPITVIPVIKHLKARKPLTQNVLLEEESVIACLEDAAYARKLESGRAQTAASKERDSRALQLLQYAVRTIIETGSFALDLQDSKVFEETGISKRQVKSLKSYLRDLGILKLIVKQKGRGTYPLWLFDLAYLSIEVEEKKNRIQEAPSTFSRYADPQLRTQYFDNKYCSLIEQVLEATAEEMNGSSLLSGVDASASFVATFFATLKNTDEALGIDRDSHRR